jgi:hypothetical protein
VSGRVTWRGDEVRSDANAAAALALTRLGIGIVSEALPNTPVARVRGGTLRRSLHVAEPGADHSGDFEAAKAGRDFSAGQTAQDRSIAGRARGKRIVVQVGSWLKYALKQEISHKTKSGFIMNALQSSRRNLPGLLKVAWGEVTGK